MPAVSLSAFGGVGAQFFDNNGVILTGGKIYTYEAGTTTPLASYTSSSGNTAHANPIVLDSAGRVPGGEIWIALRLYKFVLETSTGLLIATYDNVGSSFNAAAIIANFTGNGSTVAFTLASAPPAGENATNIYINGVYQQKNTYSVAGAVVTFSQAPPVTSSIEVNYV
jgi:hypothetical protein